MNINKLYDYVPQRDAFIDIEIENELTNGILSEYETCAEYCLCIYGVTETVLDECLVSVAKKAEEYLLKISEHIPEDTLWDLQCRPIFLFENKETAIIFMDFANTLSEEDYVSFMDELERDYYEPWTHIQMIRQSQIYEIIDHYEGRFFCD